MVKSYMRYALQDSFGTINSSGCKSITLMSPGLVITGTDETITVWKCSSGDPKLRLNCKLTDHSIPSPVTCFLYSRIHGKFVYVGYADGSIRRFELSDHFESYEVDVIYEEFHLYGHKAAVTCLTLSHSSQLLASGSKDCTIVIWETSGDGGLFRLEGHRNEITGIAFLKHSADKDRHKKVRTMASSTSLLADRSDDILGFLISTSKDCVVRIWDLSSQLCVQTIVHSTGELYSLVVNLAETRMYVGGAENRIRCYKLDVTGLYRDENSPYDVTIYSKELPYLNRQGARGKCKCLRLMYPRNFDQEVGKNIDPDSLQGLMLCVTSKFVEVYRIFNTREAKKRNKRRQKRIMEKKRNRCNKLKEILRATGNFINTKFESIDEEIVHLETVLRGATPPCEVANTEDSKLENAASDEISFMFAINAMDRISSFETVNNGFVIGHPTNSFSVWRLPLQKLLSSEPKGEDYDENFDGLLSLCERIYHLYNIGHPDPIRFLSVSHDDTMVMSVSSVNIKLWNSYTHNCVKTIDCEELNCGFFMAGNKHVLVGTNKGVIRIIYLDSCDVFDVFEEKNSEIIAMSEYPNHASFAVAFSNREIKFFDIFLKKKNGKESVAIKCTKQAQVGDDPLDMTYSMDGKFLAVSLQDGTIQTFYGDSLKLFLILYGHKLPVTSISISSDGTLLASSSMDKTVKIWGLDFGNIHKSLLAHSNSVVKCKWLNDTHYLVTTGLDFMVKIWDCDTYELITQLRGHNKAVRSLGISSDSHFFVTAGEDSTIRFWNRTDEQLFLSEEKEKELEIQLESEAVREDLNQSIPVNKDTMFNRATRKTIESVKATEQLMQIIDEAEEYRQALEAHDQRLREIEELKNSFSGTHEYEAKKLVTPKLPEPPLELFKRTPQEHVMRAVCSLNNNVIHEVLVALPFLYAEKLLHYIVISLEKYTMKTGGGEGNLLSMEVACRTALIILQIYFRQFCAFPHQRPLLARLEKFLPEVLQHEMDRLMHNRAALEYLKTIVDTQVIFKRLRDM